MSYTKMSELLESYREFLDECYTSMDIGGITFDASRVLEELDPIAFRCGYLDFADSLDVDVDSLEDDL